MHAFSLTHRSDADVLGGVKKLVGKEREATAWLVAHLAEIEERKLFLQEGCSCVRKYCTEVLRLSEPAAERRIHAARVARQFPVVFRMLHEGLIHLTTVSILGPCLTRENQVELLQAARHKTKELLLLAASANPKPDVPSTVRKLPVRGPAAKPVLVDAGVQLLELGSARDAHREVPSEREEVSKSENTAEQISSMPPAPAPIKRAVVAPLSPERYRVQFTASAETTQKLRQLQELMRHQVPNGDPARILEMAIDFMHEHVMGQKVAQVKRPRVRQASGTALEPPQKQNRKAPSRHIPAEVKRGVWSRDGGQCAFVTRAGRRCSERGWLEFHHLEPYGWGGPATIDNIALRCRAHNAYEGEQVFGKVVRTSKGGAGGVAGRSVGRASAT